MDRNPFGKLIRRLRKERKLTIDRLAKMCGTHKGYISGIERNRVNPPAPQMTRKIAKALDADGTELILLGWAQKSPLEIRARLLHHFEAIDVIVRGPQRERV